MVHSGVMRGSRVTDASTTSQQNRHFQSAAAHVLHLGDLVHDLTKRIVDEVDEHEVDDWPRSGHRCSASESHEASFANRRIAKSIAAVLGMQSKRRSKIAAALADPFAHDEDFRVGRHGLIEGFERSGDER